MLGTDLIRVVEKDSSFKPPCIHFNLLAYTESTPKVHSGFVYLSSYNNVHAKTLFINSLHSLTSLIPRLSCKMSSTVYVAPSKRKRTPFSHAYALKILFNGKRIKNVLVPTAASVLRLPACWPVRRRKDVGRIILLECKTKVLSIFDTIICILNLICGRTFFVNSKLFFLQFLYNMKAHLVSLTCMVPIQIHAQGFWSVSIECQYQTKMPLSTL